MLKVNRRNLSQVVVAAALTFATAGADSATAQTIGVVSGEVIEFQVLQGNQSRAFSTLRRLQQSFWIFEPATGAFYFYPLDYYQAGLPPFVGRYSFSDNRIRFQATFGMSFGNVGSNTGQVSGDIVLGDGEPVVTMRWEHSAITAAFINNQGFGSNASSIYHFRATLRHAW